MYVVSGRMAVRMDDGATAELGPGDVGVVPPGHDAWVVGNEPVVGAKAARTVDRITGSYSTDMAGDWRQVEASLREAYRSLQ
jgi:hypothetical protein